MPRRVRSVRCWSHRLVSTGDNVRISRHLRMQFLRSRIFDARDVGANGEAVCRLAKIRVYKCGCGWNAERDITTRTIVPILGDIPASS
jgi:hypothetical protein